MSIKGIIEKEDGKHIYCYKQGVFWVCYEQSAYAIFLQKGYKPTKKIVKAIGQEVVSVGFPQSVMGQWEKQNTCITKEQNFCVFTLATPLSLQEYEVWKSELSAVEKVEKKNAQDNDMEQSILSIIKSFPLAHKTPVDAFLLIKELQDKLI